jgi:hypothetical protein
MEFSTAALPKMHILQIDNRHVSSVGWKQSFTLNMVPLNDFCTQIQYQIIICFKTLSKFNKTFHVTVSTMITVSNKTRRF